MMPHSETPPPATDDSSRTISQGDAIKSEPETQDIAMDDPPTLPAAEKPKINLEELFDDENSDDEFTSSAPGPTAQDDLSQPAPVFVRPSIHSEGQY